VRWEIARLGHQKSELYTANAFRLINSIFRGKISFTRFDRCEFVKCTLLIDHGTETTSVYQMRVQRLQHR